MKYLLFLFLFLAPAINTDAQKKYGKYGQCKSKTQKNVRCKNNASKTGYCGKHTI